MFACTCVSLLQLAFPMGAESFAASRQWRPSRPSSCYRVYKVSGDTSIRYGYTSSHMYTCLYVTFKQSSKYVWSSRLCLAEASGSEAPVSACWCCGSGLLSRDDGQSRVKELLRTGARCKGTDASRRLRVRSDSFRLYVRSSRPVAFVLSSYSKGRRVQQAEIKPCSYWLGKEHMHTLGSDCKLFILGLDFFVFLLLFCAQP